MENKPMWQPLLWFIAGALIGFGLLAFDIFFLFIPCVIVGLCLVVTAFIRWGSRQLWIAFLGLGVIPALILLYDILFSLYTTCEGKLRGGSFACSDPLPSAYYILFVISGIIVVLASIWPFVRRMVGR